jgi:hypothetical protein
MKFAIRGPSLLTRRPKAGNIENGDTLQQADKFITVPYLLNSPDRCPTDIDEIAEAFVMKRLSAAEARQFAVHCITCRRCAVAAEDASAFVRAMKNAARLLRGTDVSGYGEH